MLLNRSVIVGLLARDCKDAIVRNKPKIEKLCSFFEDYHIVVVENDSTDGTQEVLQNWADENSRVVVDSFNDHSEHLTDSSFERISHMVLLRNRLLDDIRQLPAPDIVVMMDVDIYDFDVEGLGDSIRQAPAGWGGLMANGRCVLPDHRFLKYQYDQYALMAIGEEMSHMHMDMFTTRHLFRRGRMLDQLVQRCNYVSVNSAFGGIGVYRYEAIKSAKYHTVKIDNSQRKVFCEHVPFHVDIVHQGYKIYVCRQMIVNNGILKAGFLKALVIYYFPQVYAVLCDVFKHVNGESR